MSDRRGSAPTDEGWLQITLHGDKLAAAIGEEAEWLVYFYVSCDRRFSYPHLAQPRRSIQGSLPGTVLSLPQAMRRDFTELTAENELDIAAVNPDLRAQCGPGLLRLSTSWRNLLSDPAWHAVQATVASPATCTPQSGGHMSVWSIDEWPVS